MEEKRVMTPMGEGVITLVVTGKQYTLTLNINGSGARIEGKIGAGRSHHETSWFGVRAAEAMDEELEAYLYDHLPT